MRRSIWSLLVACLVLVGACSGDGDDAAPEVTAPVATSTTRTQDTGGIDVPEVPGTFAAAVPALGFGIAVPEGWQATVLTEESLGRLADADLAQPSFLDAATSVASTGAVFYAAGIDEDGAVAELKVDVQDDADTSPLAIRALAQSVADSGQVDDVEIVADPDDDRVRVDYRVVLPSAEDGGTIDVLGSQLFVPDGDRLWSFIVTSEDEATQTALLGIFDASIVFD